MNKMMYKILTIDPFTLLGGFLAISFWGFMLHHFGILSVLCGLVCVLLIAYGMGKLCFAIMRYEDENNIQR